MASDSVRFMIIESLYMKFIWNLVEFLKKKKQCYLTVFCVALLDDSKLSASTKNRMYYFIPQVAPSPHFFAKCGDGLII